MNSDFAKSVRQLRSRLNLSQEQLAQRLNVSFATVNRWENAKSEPQGAQRDSLLSLMEEAGISELFLRPEIGEDIAPSRRKRGMAKSAVLSTKSMEQMLWDAACSIRGEKDAPKFKDYILPLIFIKRLSDVFEDEIARLVETYGDKKTALKILEDDHSLVRFYIPPQARWPVVSGREQFDWPKTQKPKTLGEQLTTTIRVIVKHNQSLSGVIDIVDYNETRNGEREISDKALSGVIETLSDPRYRLGLHDVEPDFLGRAYEYLLRKFAEGQGQSAGEFFTPQEVGWLMAFIVRPRQGEEVYDYACGSAGLLIKCELALQQRERKISRPLKLNGQELTGSSYAIARMNMVIHDMEGEIVRGNSITNPKFLEGETGFQPVKSGTASLAVDSNRPTGRMPVSPSKGLKKFDIVVANPMWNQDIDPAAYENDPFGRFEEQGGMTTGKADWAWLQHTLASLKPNGRAAVVLDTGAITRGSGSRNEDKEKRIRRWFVEQDVIEGVILLPDNLFYNTTAPGIILLLNRQKPKSRQGKIVLVNASEEFKKGQPKNYIPEAGIHKIADAFIKGEDVAKLVKIITTEEAAQNDYNLAPSRYVTTASAEEYREIPEIVSEMKSLEQKATKLTKELNQILKQLGVS